VLEVASLESEALRLIALRKQYKAFGRGSLEFLLPSNQRVLAYLRRYENEVVLVVYDPRKISYERLLKTFWESHDPTQGMRQGNDIGSQYRSGIYVFSPPQRAAAEASRESYAKALAAARILARTEAETDVKALVAKQ